MMRYMLLGCVVAMLMGCDRQSPEGPAATNEAKPYPLTICIVSNETLGSMGEPVVLVYEGQEVKFCCEGCVGDFKSDPAKHLAKLTTSKSEPGQ